MEKAVFALIALALVLLPHGASVAEAFMETRAEADSEVSYYRLAGSGEYVIASLNGAEAFLVSNVTGEQVTDLAVVESMLREDVYGRARFANRSAEIGLIIEEFNRSRGVGERQCRQYTGTGSFPCIDRESCIVACFSVPVCSALVNADGFWGAIFNWSSKTGRIDILSQEFSRGIGGMAGGGAAIDAQVARLDEIAALAGANRDNGLFKNSSFAECTGSGAARCFDFCPQIDYREQRLLAAKAVLVALRTQLSELSLQGARAARIIGNGQRQTEYMERRGELIAKHRLFVAVMRYNATGAYANASAIAHDAELDALMLELNATLNQSEQYERDKMYRRALETEPEIEALVDRIWEGAQQIKGRHAQIAGKLGYAGEKIERARGLGAKNSTVRALYFEHSRLGAKLNSTLEVGGFAGLEAKVDRLNADAEAAIVEAALARGNESGTGTRPTQPATPAPPPCALPLAALALLGLWASFGRGR